MRMPDSVRAIPEIARLMDCADRVDVKSVESQRELRGFVAGMLSYMPGWMRFLYRVRSVFVVLLGARQESMPPQQIVAPEEVAFERGGQASFFTVVVAEEGRFWAAEARDKMLSGYLAVIGEPLQGGGNRFHILTMAKFHHWTGPIYFTAIMPFHHMVVYFMAREAAGRRAGPAAS